MFHISRSFTSNNFRAIFLYKFVECKNKYRRITVGTELGISVLFFMHTYYIARLGNFRLYSSAFYYTCWDCFLHIVASKTAAQQSTICISLFIDYYYCTSKIMPPLFALIIQGEIPLESILGPIRIFGTKKLNLENGHKHFIDFTFHCITSTEKKHANVCIQHFSN